APAQALPLSLTPRGMVILAQRRPFQCLATGAIKPLLLPIQPNAHALLAAGAMITSRNPGGRATTRHCRAGADCPPASAAGTGARLPAPAVRAVATSSPLGRPFCFMCLIVHIRAADSAAMSEPSSGPQDGQDE